MIVAADEVPFEDIQTVLGQRDHAARCQCWRLKVPGWI